MIWTTAICLLSGLYLLTLDTTMARCINCLIAIPFNQLYLYEVINMSPEIITIIEEWIVREVAEGDMICQECFNLVLNELPNEGNTSEQQVGHHHVCVCCGISIARITRRRSRPLLNHNAESAFIASIISPNQIPPNGRVCDNCWQRARRHVQEQGHVQVDEPVEQPAEAQQVPSADVEVVHSSASSITEAASASVDIGGSSSIETEEMILEGYSRTSDSTRHCFVPDCINTQRLRVPLNLKRKILTNYKLYITPNARICEEHSGVYNWEFLETYEFTSTFQRVHIVEMVNLLTRETNNNLDFERVEEMNNTTCRYWTGLSILNFLSILNCLTQLPILCRRPKTALAIYLIRLRTGEPYRRLASLFLMSTFLICSYLKKVRSCLEQEYVHLYLGCNNIPRESLSNRNLLIPQGLFGTSQNNPIIIMDGTYVYLNKSSNYFFQKQTYSLHKYNNLVKPFLMVASDGYIIDAFGPYAATTSDADIVNQLFGSPVSPLRSYYTEGDVFLLDRGFRDAEGLLTSLGFKIHKPESLDVGESQLTTIKANKSRLVTLCRWVVEVVNGRFKRDYKIFRNKYLNIASKNLMSDFRIAAAIIINFHPLITDRQDPQLILDRALQRLHMPNYLANHVIQQNLNRRRVSFVRIDAQIPQLDMFPVMEMSDLVLFSLGIYQIKQARSYYGEHIRNNGTFIVEVSDDINAVTVEGIPSSLHETVLIRGRIRSRHQSQKIYYTYILLNLINSENWQEKISNYYCSCIVGKRTVGSCAHVMTIVWYLGWARHQNNITPPAQLLDNILVREDED